MKNTRLSAQKPYVFDWFKFSRFFPYGVWLFFFRQRTSFLIPIKIIRLFGLKPQAFLLNGTTLCYKFQKQLTFCCIEKRSLMRDHLRSMTFLSNGLFSLLGIKCIKCILKSISNCLSHWFKFKKFCPINFSIFLQHSQWILWTAVECIIIST